MSVKPKSETNCKQCIEKFGLDRKVLWYCPEGKTPETCEKAAVLSMGLNEQKKNSFFIMSRAGFQRFLWGLEKCVARWNDKGCQMLYCSCLAKIF